MCKGFVKIPRRLFETRWWHQKRIYSESDAIIDLYQSAGRGNTFSTSLRTLADRWLWEQTKVMRFMTKLSKEGYIETTKTISGTIVKIVDFGVGATPSATPSVTPSATPSATPKSPSAKGLKNVDATPTATPSATLTATPTATASRAYKNDIIISCLNKEDKKNIRTPYNPPRGYENFDFSFVDDSFKAVLFDWLIYKIERKDKKYTERGLKAFYTRLTKLSSGNAETAKEIVEQSYANNWSGIFELKNHATSTTNTGYHQDTDHPSNSELFRQTADLVAQMAAERRNRQREIRERQ